MPETTPVSSRPAKRTVPAVGARSPDATRKSVVLPLPDGPTMLTNSCGASAKLTLSVTSVSEPSRLRSVTCRLSTASTGSDIVLAAHRAALPGQQPTLDHQKQGVEQPTQQAENDDARVAAWDIEGLLRVGDEVADARSATEDLGDHHHGQRNTDRHA